MYAFTLPLLCSTTHSSVPNPLLAQLASDLLSPSYLRPGRMAGYPRVCLSTTTTTHAFSTKLISRAIPLSDPCSG